VYNFLIGQTLYVNVAVTVDIVFPRPFALHRQETEKDKQNFDFAPPWKISTDAHACGLSSLVLGIYG